MQIDFYSDPGHGWAAVPLTLLDRLNLLDRITTYSYIKGKNAYLEEDCDLSAFLAAVRLIGLEIKFRDHYAKNNSRIRRFDYYTANRARQLLEMTA